jgi:thiol-disulfide isomerase/thioredoxin
MPIILGSCPANQEQRTGPCPSYKLKAGQVLTYEGRSKFEEHGNSFKTTSRAQIWVVKQNADGSWRLIARNGFSFENTGRPHEEVNLTTFDMHSDGRIDSGPNPASRNVARSCFITLPTDPNAFRTTWEAFDKEQDEQHVYSFSPRSKPHKGRWVFQEVTTSRMNEIYGVSRTSMVHFNAKKGLVEKVELDFSQTYGAGSKGSGIIKLKSIKTVDQTFMNQLSADAQTYFRALKDYRELLSSLAEHANAVDAHLAKAKSVLLSVSKKVANPIVTQELNRKLAQHDERISYLSERAKQQGEVLNQPSPDWETVDFKGQTYSIKALRGRIIVLDFWYRGCGWCIRAMPQIKQVVDYFANQPVVVLGMNIDKDPADAEFVIEKMGLNYPNLKADDIPRKYAVQGYPTLVVIDQNSIVQSFHVGYSPDLRDDVIRTVEEMLNPKPQKVHRRRQLTEM